MTFPVKQVTYRSNTYLRPSTCYHQSAKKRALVTLPPVQHVPAPINPLLPVGQKPCLCDLASQASRVGYRTNTYFRLSTRCTVLLWHFAKAYLHITAFFNKANPNPSYTFRQQRVPAPLKSTYKFNQMQQYKNLQVLKIPVLFFHTLIYKYAFYCDTDCLQYQALTIR